MFYRGNELHARFVFAYEYLTVQAGVRNSAAIIDAYAAAAKADPHADDARARARSMWEHPAVVDLLDRFRYRSEREASARVAHRYASLVEQLLIDAEGAEIGERVKVADTVVKYLKMKSNETIADRALRTRRGLADAASDVTPDSPQELGSGAAAENAPRYLKMLSEKYGAERIAEMLAEGRE